MHGPAFMRDRTSKAWTTSCLLSFLVSNGIHRQQSTLLPPAASFQKREEKQSKHRTAFRDPGSSPAPLSCPLTLFYGLQHGVSSHDLKTESR